MNKTCFDDVTVADVLTVLKKLSPALELDISCFMNELSKEKELLESPFEDVLYDYDCTLFREGYYEGEEPLITGTFYFDELRTAIKRKYPNETWFMTGDYQISSCSHKHREEWVVYEDEKRKAQFTSKDTKKRVEIEYKVLSNHKTDGIHIENMVLIKEG